MEKQKDIDGGDPDSGYLSVAKGTKLLVTVPRQCPMSFQGGWVLSWELRHDLLAEPKKKDTPVNSHIAKNGPFEDVFPNIATLDS